jgi:hypothetical protein
MEDFEIVSQVFINNNNKTAEKFCISGEDGIKTSF